MRPYGWTAPQFGLAQGLVVLLVSPFGLMLGGWLAEHYVRKGRDDANMRVVLMASLAALPFAVAYPLMPSPDLALALFALNTFAAATGIGPGNAALQIVTPNEMRGQVRALFQFVFNIVGFGLGPTFVALFTDYVFGAETSLRYALATSAAIFGPIAIGLTWYGLKPYGRSVARASRWA
jgi:sugar phosphate permease